ncbi:hypothetical protein GCM10010911_04900 [Paenibacillus nasutitermitis]|uniref:Histidine kinase domain-containing protein n=2 Tax=Paenibacillus nasutitermitis TaxID=1652958 RepID=A0A916YLB8_9BACL|nr:hypothetical protein GCM10010911_04900 [Paenibacillus nasutitermitis]
MRRNVWLLAILLIAVLLGINNTIYYFTSKTTLEERLRGELNDIAGQIQLSIELSRTGSEKFQEQIGRELRAASIAAEFALNPDIDKVTNAQLVELKKKLDMVDITLLERTKDNIILSKSSNPKQIGYKTSTWKPWYEAFNQLFDNRQVTIPWGQSLTNFWTGPFEFSTTDTNNIYKWGYYYDGTANYIIDPFISYESRQRAYDEATGVNQLIGRTLRANSSLLEIAVINPQTFLSGSLTSITDNGDKLKHITQNPIINGTYIYRHNEDQRNVKLANDSNHPVWINEKINNKHVIKAFIPVDIDKVASILNEKGQPINRYVLTLVSDYQTIEDTLDRQFVNIGLIVGVVTLLSLVVVYLAVTGYRKSQDKLVRRTQETYVDEINQLFQAIRAQRHDFINHAQMIQSLAQMNKFDELKEYATDLTGEIRGVNDMIGIGNPALAALIRSKISQAEPLKIHLETSFSDISKLSLGVKSLDLTRMLGNLIDNAFDEVADYPEEERFVRIRIYEKSGFMEFAVSNPCHNPEKLKDKPLFLSGYSDKQTGHSGLGLVIVKSIVEQYNGTVRVSFDETDDVTFTIRIPY